MMQWIAQETQLTHRYADLGDVRLHFVEAGQGSLVILLHGFSEFWYSWRHQIPALAAAGYHVVAPDMRGYNRSDKPFETPLVSGQSTAIAISFTATIVPWRDGTWPLPAYYPMLAVRDADGWRLDVTRFADHVYYVAAHEVAHQWWYAVVGNDIYREPWLDEAFAQYSGIIYALELDQFENCMLNYRAPTRS
jgi:pimeloyl-ACP methyl ester carboxylesterase